MIRHYKGNLGEFNYDDDEFEIELEETDHQWIRYVGNGLTVNLPKGCIDTSYMFYDKELPRGFALGDNFDTSSVVRMDWMFRECKLPKGFSLGDKFDTSNVETMNSMFYNCVISEGFTLGDKFDTSNVKDMFCMFNKCIMPEGFTLGNRFDTSNVEDMEGMFKDCILPESFTLCSKFLNNANSLFTNTKFPSWVVINEGTTEDDIIEQLKKPLVYACSKELVKLVKEGKSLVEAKGLLNSFDFNIDTIEIAVGNLKDKLNQACSNAIVSLFSIKDTKEEHSEYTVGEVCTELLNKGFPKEVVMESIVTYLKDQVLF